MNPGEQTGGGRIAVIGSGVSGMTAAYLLSRRFAVTLFERDNRLGGHVHTHSIADPSGVTVAVDSGFIVHNDDTYPLLRRLFAELGVERHATEMSMSISDAASGLEYAGGRGAKGVFAQPRRALDPSFLGLLGEVRRFHRSARQLLERNDDSGQMTYGDFLAEQRFSTRFIDLFAVPVVSCVWSMGASTALNYPARYLFQFLANHGMLAVSGSPRWYTVVGGARTYVDAIASRLSDVRVARGVTAVRRDPSAIALTTSDGGVENFDGVVVATHPKEALALLADATVAEREVLGAFRYSASEVVLHTDERLLPASRRARAAWNYRTPGTDEQREQPVVTYWMNRLQGLETEREYLVTLNARDRIAPDQVLAVMQYEHPVYDLESVGAQARLGSLATDRTVFAGAYHGWGFHEDGCRSGVEAAQHFGVIW